MCNDPGVARHPSRAHDDRIVSFVMMYRRQHGYGPAYREIASDAKIPLSTLVTILARLVGEGRLARVPNIPRTVTVPTRKVPTP